MLDTDIRDSAVVEQCRLSASGPELFRVCDGIAIVVDSPTVRHDPEEDVAGEGNGIRPRAPGDGICPARYPASLVPPVVDPEHPSPSSLRARLIDLVPSLRPHVPNDPRCESHGNLGRVCRGTGKISVVPADARPKCSGHRPSTLRGPVVDREITGVSDMAQARVDPLLGQFHHRRRRHERAVVECHLTVIRPEMLKCDPRIQRSGRQELFPAAGDLLVSPVLQALVRAPRQGSGNLELVIVVAVGRVAIEVTFGSGIGLR